MTHIRLHHCHQTRSMRVLWLLHELGVPFDVITSPFDAALQSEAYRALNPLGRVPALEIGGAAMFESGAMIEVLTEMFPEAGLGRGPGEEERMAFLQWLHFAETTSTHIQALTQQHIMLFEDHMRSPVVMKIEAKRLARCFAAVEARLGETGDTLLPRGFSAADIAVAQAVWMGGFFVRTGDFPAVSRWLEQMSERAAFQASLPPDGASLLYAREFYPPWTAET